MKPPINRTFRIAVRDRLPTPCPELCAANSALVIAADEHDAVRVYNGEPISTAIARRRLVIQEVVKQLHFMNGL